MKDYSNSKIPRMFQLMHEKGIKGADITRDLHVSSGNISDWKSGRHAPAYAIIVTIADYLNTTAEYLLGETDIKEKTPGTGSINAVTAFGTITMAVTKEEAEIIQAYRSYPEVGKKIVRRTLGLEGISPDAATAAYGGKDTQVGKFEE